MTQQNAANAEESASASEELASQAEEMRSTAANFKLTETKNNITSVDTISPIKKIINNPKSLALKKPGDNLHILKDPKKIIPFDENDEKVLRSF
ncbi:hypothetical protein HZA55_09600 [Candidatus Poribacteria bacterium]|nr:hypothetical protein [Candidatus Poribacteria bacterium]